VEGVNLYRARGRDYSARIIEPGKPAGQPPIKDKGPTIALMPGMAVIASTPKAAREVVRRAKGKVSEPALSSLGAFKRAAAARDKANVFAYADVGALATRLDEATAGKRNNEWEVVRALANPRGMGAAVATLSLQNGNLEARVQVQLDPRQPSALLDLLPDKKASLDGMHFAPKDGLLTVTVPWADGAKRWERVVALIDNMARAGGAPPDALPSKEIEAAEQRVGVKLGKDVFAKVAALTVTVDLSGEQHKNGLPLMLAVTATDEQAAKGLADAVPLLLSLAARDKLDAPAAEKVAGATVRGFPATSVPWKAPLYYGQEGKTVVLGPTKDAVAAALAGGAKGGGLLGETKVAAALKGTDDATVVGTWSLGETLLALYSSSAPTRPGTVKPSAPPGGDVKPAKEKADEGAQLVKEMRQAMAPLPPAVLTLTRKNDVVVLELKQTGLKTVSAKAINVLIDAAAREIKSPRGGNHAPVPEPDEAVPIKP
jgi:hypothetical protein